MNTLNSLLRLLAVSAAVQVSSVAHSGDDQTLPESIANLLHDAPENDPIALEAWRSNLRSAKGVTPALLTLLWQSLAAEKPDEVGRTLIALRYRDDIGSESVRQLTAKLGDIIKDKLPSRESANFVFALGAISVIANNDKSASTERLFSRFLMDAEVHSDWRFFDDQVLHALKLIGGSDSVRAIDDHVKRRWGSEATKSWEYQKFAETETAIKTRLASTTPSVTTSPQQVPSPTAKRSPTSSSVSAQESNIDNDATPWVVWAVMIAAAMGLLWLVLKRRAK